MVTGATVEDLLNENFLVGVRELYTAVKKVRLRLDLSKKTYLSDEIVSMRINRLNYWIEPFYASDAVLNQL